MSVRCITTYILHTCSLEHVQLASYEKLTRTNWTRAYYSLMEPGVVHFRLNSWGVFLPLPSLLHWYTGLRLVLYLNIFPLCCVSPLLHSVWWLPLWMQYSVSYWQLKHFHPLQKSSFLDIQEVAILLHTSSSTHSSCFWSSSGGVKDERLTIPV